VADLWLLQIDVRDLAAAHVVGMTHPKAAGERFLMAHEAVTYKEIMQELAPIFGPLGYHVTTSTISYKVARLLAAFEPRLRFGVSENQCFNVCIYVCVLPIGSIWILVCLP
jgi:nucleoside-diphosphate-sugar epimerase